MIRVWIAAGILLGWITMSVGSVWLVRSQCQDMLDALDVLEQQSNPPEAHAAVAETWKQADQWLMLVVSRDRLMAVENTLNRLQPLADASCEEFTAELSAARLLLVQLMDSETPSVWTVL